MREAKNAKVRWVYEAAEEGTLDVESDGSFRLIAALGAYLQCRTISLAAARKQLGINEMDAKAILFVADNPGARPSQLKDHLRVTAAGVTTLVERLVQRGIFRREFDQNDRRVNHIHLVVDVTAEPWSLLTKFDDDCQTAASGLDPDVATQFAAFLETTLANRRTLAADRTGSELPTV